jgi:ATP-dependent Clp protease adaptor protein ClpS
MLTPEELVEPVDTDIDREGFALILFNDSHHDFEEVTGQIIKATGYSYERAEEITLEAHNKGKAVVITGNLEQCLRVQAVLEEIALRTSLEVSV